jgi:hypothetical protein
MAAGTSWQHRYYPSDDGTYHADNLWYSAPTDMLQSLQPLAVSAPELVQEAIDTMKPSMSSGLSLTNFILELGDIKQMFRLWNPRRRYSRLRNVIRGIAGANLNYQFGWKLFIQDCKRIYSNLTAFDKAFHDFKSRIGKVQRRRFRKKFDTETDRVYATTSSSVDKWTDVSWDAEFVATMRYTYSVPLIDSKYAEYRALMDALGLRLSPSVIWEAIPYSFVVDWFINVGDFLSQFDTDYLESEMTILDFCYSITRHQAQEFVLHWKFNDDQRLSMGTVQEVDYVRRRCMPSDSIFGLHSSDRFGTRQVGLAASLLLA